MAARPASCWAARFVSSDSGQHDSPQIPDSPAAFLESCKGYRGRSVLLAQYLTGLSVDEMHSGAGRTGDNLVLVFGNIRIVIQLVWDVEAGRRTLEMGHRQNMTALRRQAMI
jgi:hypothetical protein